MDMTQDLATKHDLEHASRRMEQSLDQLDRRCRALEQRVDSIASAIRDVESELRRRPWEFNSNLELFVLIALGSFWLMLIALILKDKG